MLWVKSWSPVAISTQPRLFIDATIALCRRNPEYVADPRFYDGLARDVARQMSRLLRAGQWRDAGRDVRLLRREFGAAETLRLLRHGWREANARKRAKQAAAPSAASRGGRRASRAARSRAKPRS